MSQPSWILLQTDPTEWPLPAVGKTFLGIDENGKITLKQHDGTVAVIESAGPSLDKQVNDDGVDITVIPATGAHREIITIGGSARTQLVEIDSTALTNGSSLTILFDLPDTAGILIEVFSEGTLQWAFENTTGAQLKAAVELYKDGAQWKTLRETIPAFTPAS